MSKPLNPDTQPSLLRPSRIRREPPPVVKPRELNPHPTEREVLTVALGVFLFAVAITIIIFAVSDYTS